MFLPMPDLSATDADACLGVRFPAVLVDHAGDVVAVGFTRPDIARDAITEAAYDIGAPLPSREDAARFRLAWYVHADPWVAPNTARRRAMPGEDGAFPVVIWRAADIADAHAAGLARVTAHLSRMAVAA